MGASIEPTSQRAEPFCVDKEVKNTGKKPYFFQLIHDFAQKAINTSHKISNVSAAILITLGAIIAAASLLTLVAVKITVALPLMAVGLIVGISIIALGALLYAAPKAIEYYYRQKFDALSEQKMLYHKVLDSTGRNKELEGSRYTKTISSIIEDLEAYQETLDSHQYPFDQLIEELKFAKKVDTANFRYLPAFLTKFFNQNEDMAKEISERLKQLQKPGSQLIIPGGSKDHAVLYHIKREDNGTLSFTIIDTGGFTDNHPQFKHAKEGIDGRHSKHGYTYNPTYTNLTEETLTEDFILKLLQRNYKQSFMKNLDFIHSKLRNDESPNIEYRYTQRLQSSGTCSMKSIFGLLRNELGVKEYRKFKVFMTNRELEKARKRQTSIPHILCDKVFNHGREWDFDIAMGIYTQKQNKKRKKKAAHSLD